MAVGMVEVAMAAAMVAAVMVVARAVRVAAAKVGERAEVEKAAATEAATAEEATEVAMAARQNAFRSQCSLCPVGTQMATHTQPAPSLDHHPRITRC